MIKTKPHFNFKMKLIFFKFADAWFCCDGDAHFVLRFVFFFSSFFDCCFASRRSCASLVYVLCLPSVRSNDVDLCVAQLVRNYIQLVWIWVPVGATIQSNYGYVHFLWLCAICLYAIAVNCLLHETVFQYEFHWWLFVTWTNVLFYVFKMTIFMLVSAIIIYLEFFDFVFIMFSRWFLLYGFRFIVTVPCYTHLLVLFRWFYFMNFGDLWFYFNIFSNCRY